MGMGAVSSAARFFFQSVVALLSVSSRTTIDWLSFAVHKLKDAIGIEFAGGCR
jgi:hypothetical protein